MANSIIGPETKSFEMWADTRMRAIESITAHMRINDIDVDLDVVFPQPIYDVTKLPHFKLRCASEQPFHVWRWQAEANAK